jgi:hypothetical protein
MYIEFENNFGSGMSLLGDVIENEFIVKLQRAKSVLSELNTLTGSGNLGSSDPDAIDKMKARSIAWHKADAVTKKILEAKSLEEGTKLGWTRKDDGYWYKPDGTRAFGKGGVNDRPGLAMLHGTKQSSEVIFNATDAKKLYDIIHQLPEIRTPVNSNLFNFTGLTNSFRDNGYGDITVTVPIAVNGSLDRSVVPDIVEQVGKAVRIAVNKRGTHKRG